MIPPCVWCWWLRFAERSVAWTLQRAAPELAEWHRIDNRITRLNAERGTPEPREP